MDKEVVWEGPDIRNTCTFPKTEKNPGPFMLNPHTKTVVVKEV